MNTTVFIFSFLILLGYSKANATQDSLGRSLDTLQINTLKKLESKDSLFSSMNSGLSGNSHIELGSALVVVGLGLTFATDSMKEGSVRTYLFSASGLAFSIIGVYEIFHGLIKKGREKRAFEDG